MGRWGIWANMLVKTILNGFHAKNDFVQLLFLTLMRYLGQERHYLMITYTSWSMEVSRGGASWYHPADVLLGKQIVLDSMLSIVSRLVRTLMSIVEKVGDVGPSDQYIVMVVIVEQIAMPMCLCIWLRVEVKTLFQYENRHCCHFFCLNWQGTNFQYCMQPWTKMVTWQHNWGAAFPDTVWLPVIPYNSFQMELVAVLI